MEVRGFHAKSYLSWNSVFRTGADMLNCKKSTSQSADILLYFGCFCKPTVLRFSSSVCHRPTICRQSADIRPTSKKLTIQTRPSSDNSVHVYLFWHFCILWKFYSFCGKHHIFFYCKLLIPTIYTICTCALKPKCHNESADGRPIVPDSLYAAPK